MGKILVALAMWYIAKYYYKNKIEFIFDDLEAEDFEHEPNVFLVTEQYRNKITFTEVDDLQHRLQDAEFDVNLN